MATPLLVGLQLPEVERDVRWPELVAMARAAEDVGFDSIWVGDHLLDRGRDRPDGGPRGAAPAWSSGGSAPGGPGPSSPGSASTTTVGPPGSRKRSTWSGGCSRAS